MADLSLRRQSSQISRTSSHRLSRQSSTIRARPDLDASVYFPKTSRTPDEQSLTSFPSLSPAPEDSLNDRSSDAVRELEGSVEQGETPAVGTQIQSRKPSSNLDALFDTASLQPDEISLFEDHPRDVRSVPGTIHHQNNEQIEGMLARVGPVTLVRQLAEDLARRDAQITTLRNRTEERERLFRRMLRECEVSNLDIERRLKQAEKHPSSDSRRPSSTYGMHESREDAQRPGEDLGIKDLLAEACDDSIGWSARKKTSDQALQAKSRSTSGAVPGSGPAAGWKSYFTSVSGTQSNQRPIPVRPDDSSIPKGGLEDSAGGRRLGRPAVPTKRSSSAMESLKADLSKDQSQVRHDRRGIPHKASGSIASWAVRLVTGRSNQSGDVLSGDDTSKAPISAGSTPIAQPRLPNTAARARGVQTSQASKSNDARRSSRSAKGPNGTIKPAGIDPKDLSSLRGLRPATPPQSVISNDATPGPVEMDRILPDDIRPPTLASFDAVATADAAGLLTDRFGFIYDQRRRRRQNEAAATWQGSKSKRANVETLENHRRPLSPTSGSEEEIRSMRSQESLLERPETPASMEDRGLLKSGWQDLFKPSSAQGELLSHTPAASSALNARDGADPSLEPKQSTRIALTKRGSEPMLSPNPQPMPSRVSSDLAELARPFQSDHNEGPLEAPNVQPDAGQDPVKSLLEQLTEVHDRLQKEKTTKWNEFLRKVRADRKKSSEGSASNDRHGISTPESLVGDGEIIGITSLGNKGKVGKAKWNEFRALVLRGIPVAYRAKVWSECSGAMSLRIPGSYDDLVSAGTNDQVIVQQIQMDITRTLTDNVFFRHGVGVKKLKEVLLAYARRNPEVGYCQGMNLITAHLLLIMPTAEDAFWILASMVENILPQKYYDSSLLTSRADQQVLRLYVAELLPQLSDHLDGLGIELEALTFQWFLSVFTDCLSAEALFRVWDVVLCMQDGSTFLFQVALALLKLNEKHLLACDNPAAIYAYINQHMTDHAISIDGLIRASEALKKVVKGDDVRARRETAVEREEEAIRVREAIRNGNDLGKLSAGNSSTSPGAGDVPKVGDLQTAEVAGEVLRKSATAAEDEIMNYDKDLTFRTPMPIDEEAQWRA